MARVVVHIPFHRMEVPGANRYMDNPKWWNHRARILGTYSLKSLAAQTDQDFTVLVTLRDVDCQPDNPVVRVAEKHGAVCLGLPYMAWKYPIAPNHHAWFCERYRGAYWLIVLHLDSDDCYAPDVVALLRKERLREGLIMWFAFGWQYGVNDGKLCWFGSTTGPPPFFAEVYNKASLQSTGAFGAYRRKWGFECYHHQVVRASHTRRLPDGKILQTIHGGNSSQAWSNPWCKRRIQRWVTGAHEKKTVLRSFGI